MEASLLHPKLLLHPKSQLLSTKSQQFSIPHFREHRGTPHSCLSSSSAFELWAPSLTSNSTPATLNPLRTPTQKVKFRISAGGDQHKSSPSGDESSSSENFGGNPKQETQSNINKGLTLLWSSSDLSALVTPGIPEKNGDEKYGEERKVNGVNVYRVALGEEGSKTETQKQETHSGDLERRAEKLLEDEMAKASEYFSSENEQQEGILKISGETAQGGGEGEGIGKGNEGNEETDSDSEDESEKRNTKDGEIPSTPTLSASSTSKSPSFRWAQSIMSSLATRVNDLEKGLKNREQDMEEGKKYVNTLKEQGGGQASRLRQAEEMARRMKLQMTDMERTVAEKDEVVQRLLQQTALSEKRVVEVERQANIDREEMRKELQSERTRSKLELDKVMRREEGLRQRLKEAQDGIAERDAFLKQLQEEAALSASALKQAAQAMVAARERTFRIEEQLEMLGDQLVKEKDNTAREKAKSAQLSADLAEAKISIADLNVRVRELEDENKGKEEELAQSNDQLAQYGQHLGNTVKALSEAERRIKELEMLLETQKDELRNEVQTSAEALEAAAARERALLESEEMTRQLSLEVDTLKSELESKEKMLGEIQEETGRNAELLMSAARTRKELEEAHRKISQLESQRVLLEAEIEEKEAFLQDVRTDAKSSADALRTAALIKQELNEVREREGMLLDELEAKESELQMLRSELEENVRAQKAELALQDVSRRASQLESERDALRSGIAKRDQALILMKQELERGSQMLNAAADTREALRSMKAQMDALQQQAQDKGRRLSDLEDELNTVGQNPFPWALPRSKRKPRPQPPGTD